MPPIEALSANPLNSKVALTWSNPSFANFAGVTVVRKLSVPPASPADGMVVYQGMASSAIDTGLANSTTYFYAIFALDDTGYVSPAVNVSATPLPSGSLDPTFGDGRGVVVHSGARQGDSTGRAVAIDAKGRIVVVGATSNRTNNDLAVWRILPDGTFDISFGDGGLVTHDSAAGGGGHDIGLAVTIDSNGRIIVAGESRRSIANQTPSDDDAVVWTFTAAGTLDTSFGNGKGFVTRSGTLQGNDYAASVFVTSDGKIVAGGQTVNNTTIYDSSLWCMLPSGDPDTSFGMSGTLTDDMGLANGSSQISALTLANDPVASNVKIVAVGSSGLRLDMFARRYTINGAVDLSFGGNYDASPSPDSWVWRGALNYYYNVASAVATQPDGSLFVTGQAAMSGTNFFDFDMVVWKLNSNGAPPDDIITRNVTSFGGGKNSFDGGNAIAVTPEGIVVVGTTGINDNSQTRVAVWRLTPDLTTDPAFAEIGLFTTGGAAGDSSDFAAAVAIDQFGRIIIVGASADGVVDQLAVWRLIP